ncbi:MAG: cbiG [Peptococcaceae bacterium]|jgi:cobalt-precorrin 5A hydrolase|nr:cbiG [Peptococcaceae bacterium]
MKKIAVLAITPNGARLGLNLAGQYPEIMELYVKNSLREIIGSTTSTISFYEQNFSEQIQYLWSRYQGIIFIMAAGIVVRTVAPFLKDKSRDPAVVVVDEQGRFAISLLSGHLGGANELCKEVAGILGAVPVITTATDAASLEAIDVWAARYSLSIEPLPHIKHFNMHLLKGYPCLIWHESYLNIETSTNPQIIMQKLPYTGQEISFCHGVVTPQQVLPGIAEPVLYLRPKILSIGVGCKRGTPAEQIIEAINEVLKENNLSPRCIKHLASLDIKKDEPGLLEAAKRIGCPVHFVNREDVINITRERNLKVSPFVQKKIGVPGVAEQAALLTTEEGEILCPKTIKKSVTIAVAREKSISLVPARGTWLT